MRGFLGWCRLLLRQSRVGAGGDGCVVLGLALGFAGPFARANGARLVSEV